MSVSIENETSENTQQNGEQEAAAQNENQSVATQNEDQEVIVQTENQEVAIQNNESPVLDTEDNDQDSKFDFEKSKGKLEYISIALALISVISTVLVKVLSVGSHLYFSFDINNYDFKLTNNDRIVFFLSIFFCVFAIIFCQITNNIRSKIFVKINNCLESNVKSKKIIGTFLWGVGYISLLGYYILLGSFIIELLCSQKDVTWFKDVLHTTYAISLLLVLTFFLFPIVRKKITKIILTILGMVTLLIISLYFINTNYEKAKNQREFEIIVAGNNEGQKQEYVVISKGSYYSAYQCSVKEQDAGKILIIHTDSHRFFPIDDTETRLNIFDEYQLYKYGEPLDTNEENNSEEYQDNEE